MCAQTARRVARPAGGSLIEKPGGIKKGRAGQLDNFCRSAINSRVDRVTVQIDLARVRENARQIARDTGVAVLAVVKSDAYGLGVRRIVEALADCVDGFCVFSLAEAIAGRIAEIGRKRVLSLGPSDGIDAEDFKAAGVQPAVWNAQRARELRPARPILSVDTGMQRFACPAEEIDAAIAAGDINEAFTHATNLEQVRLFLKLTGNRPLVRHAAATALLCEPQAWLDAVRPGLAIYRGAVRTATSLIDARDSRGPVGYGRFASARHGVILCGYTHGLRPGPCRIHGGPRRIVEVGMQSSFVELEPGDQIGDEVVLLGEGLTESDLAGAWRTSPQEALYRMSRLGPKDYRS